MPALAMIIEPAPEARHRGRPRHLEPMDLPSRSPASSRPRGRSPSPPTRCSGRTPMCRFSSLEIRASIRVGDRVAGHLAGVAVRDPGRELLERHVRHGLERRLVAGVVAGGHVVHPGPARARPGRHRGSRRGSRASRSRAGSPPPSSGPPRCPRRRRGRRVAILAGGTTGRLSSVSRLVNIAALGRLRELRLLGAPVLAAQEREGSRGPGFHGRSSCGCHFLRHREVPVEVLEPRRARGPPAGWSA